MWAGPLNPEHWRLISEEKGRKEAAEGEKPKRVESQVVDREIESSLGFSAPVSEKEKSEGDPP